MKVRSIATALVAAAAATILSVAPAVGREPGPYDVTCTSDVSPATRKLLVLEGKDKHALRGTSRIDAGGGDVLGGDYKADGFKKAPAIKAMAEQRWKDLLGK